MNTYTTVDKSAWGDGPWQDEPDKVSWIDPETRYPCLIVRGPVGALCGYVGVPREHPLFEHDWGTVDVDVHGGLTYSRHCDTDADEATGICHVPTAGADGDVADDVGDVWWFGFDCAHAFDLAPALRLYLNTGHMEDPSSVYRVNGDPWRDIYRDVDYVTHEVTRLAGQLARIFLDARLTQS